MKRPTEKQKLYVIRKYVMARSVIDAARKEKNVPAHDIFIEDKWQEKNLTDAIGFTSISQEE